MTIVLWRLGQFHITPRLLAHRRARVPPQRGRGLQEEVASGGLEAASLSCGSSVSRLDRSALESPSLDRWNPDRVSAEFQLSPEETDQQYVSDTSARFGQSAEDSAKWQKVKCTSLLYCNLKYGVASPSPIGTFSDVPHTLSGGQVLGFSQLGPASGVGWRRTCRPVSADMSYCSKFPFAKHTLLMLAVFNFS